MSCWKNDAVDDERCARRNPKKHSADNTEITKNVGTFLHDEPSTGAVFKHYMIVLKFPQSSMDKVLEKTAGHMSRQS